MDNIYPKITVVTVTYNCASILEDTILSVINQDYPNVEYIIIDGASKDETVDIIKKYSNKISKWISKSDSGIYDAMNKGLNLATGDWINFMNAGDRFCNNKIVSNIYKDVRYGEKIAVIFGSGQTRMHKGIKDDKRPIPFFEQQSRFQSMGFNHQNTFVRTDMAQKYQFDLKFKIAADYNMIRKIYEAGHQCLYINCIIACTEGRDGLSASNRRKQRFEVAQICKCENSMYFRLFDYYNVFKSYIKTIFRLD